MSDDLIKREAVLSTIESMYERCTTDSLADYRALMLEAVKVLPYADRPSGEWTPCTKNGLPLTELGRREGQKWYGYKCSECNFIYKGNALIESPFCQNCGCRMKGADDDD